MVEEVLVDALLYITMVQTILLDNTLLMVVQAIYSGEGLALCI